ncbi:ABC transporter ATP-binding protein [Actinomadura viridis]|uniref:ABC transporter ATP-binding protein n=1 Tax=Actinomadura viridis TaxID=58110 RepID=UPI00367A4F10
MTDDKIRVESVSYRYRRRGRTDVDALSDVALAVGKGEFISVVGPSGCGKSTLLRVIAGLQKPTGGQVRVRHDDTGRALMAPVFQEYSIFPWRTVEDNVRLGLDAAGTPRKEAEARSREWIDRVGLTGFESAYPGNLSGGMKQRVALARAFVVEPEILLMDEPFAALDAQLRKVLQEELLEIVREGRYTVFFVTHNLDEAILLSDRIVLMSARPGRVRRVFDVPFDRPRTPELRKDSGFVTLEDEIWSELRGEVTADAGGE